MILLAVRTDALPSLVRRRRGAPDAAPAPAHAACERACAAAAHRTRPCSPCCSWSRCVFALRRLELLHRRQRGRDRAGQRRDRPPRPGADAGHPDRRHRPVRRVAARPLPPSCSGAAASRPRPAHRRRRRRGRARSASAAARSTRVLVARLGMPPLIVTLGTYSLFRGLAEGFTGGVKNYTDFPAAFLFLGQGRVPGGLPAQAPRAGRGRRRVLAARAPHRPSGGACARSASRPEGARFAGIPVARRLASSTCSAGPWPAWPPLVYAARLGQAKADAGTGYELFAITAVVLGGTSIFGGRGSVARDAARPGRAGRPAERPAPGRPARGAGGHPHRRPADRAPSARNRLARGKESRHETSRVSRWRPGCAGGARRRRRERRRRRRARRAAAASPSR